MTKLRTMSQIFQGTEVTKTYVNMLLYSSQWFQLEPLPDDEYEITVKEEVGYLIKPVVK